MTAEEGKAKAKAMASGTISAKKATAPAASVTDCCICKLLCDGEVAHFADVPPS